MRPITNNKKETHRSRDVIGIQYTSKALELIDNFFNDVKRKCNSDEETKRTDDVILPLIDRFAYNLEHSVLPYILEHKDLFVQDELKRYGYDVFSFLHSMYEIDYNSKGEMTEEDLYQHLSIFQWSDRKTYKASFRLRDNANDLFRLIMNREYVHNSVISYIPFLFNYFTSYFVEDFDFLYSKGNKEEVFIWIEQSIKNLITSGTKANEDMFRKNPKFSYRYSHLLTMDIQFDLNTGSVEQIDLSKDHFHHHRTETPISIYMNGNANVFVCFNIDEQGTFGIELSDKMASSVKTSVLSLITQLKRGSISSDFFNNTINKFKLNVPTLREGENEVEFLVTFLRELYKHLLGLI